MTTVPIEHFIVRLADGSVKKIKVGKGEGYYREQHLQGSLKSVYTYEVFVTNGDPQDIPTPTRSKNDSKC